VCIDSRWVQRLKREGRPSTFLGFPDRPREEGDMLKRVKARVREKTFFLLTIYYWTMTPQASLEGSHPSEKNVCNAKKENRELGVEVALTIFRSAKGFTYQVLDRRGVLVSASCKKSADREKRQKTEDTFWGGKGGKYPAQDRGQK